MLEHGAEVLPEVKDRVISLLLMVFFLLLGVAWGVAVTAELESRSTSSSRGVPPRETPAAIQTRGQKHDVQAGTIAIRQAARF